MGKSVKIIPAIGLIATLGGVAIGIEGEWDVASLGNAVTAIIGVVSVLIDHHHAAVRLLRGLFGNIAHLVEGVTVTGNHCAVAEFCGLAGEPAHSVITKLGGHAVRISHLLQLTVFAVGICDGFAAVLHRGEAVKLIIAVCGSVHVDAIAVLVITVAIAVPVIAGSTHAVKAVVIVTERLAIAWNGRQAHLRVVTVTVHTVAGHSAQVVVAVVERAAIRFGVGAKSAIFIVSIALGRAGKRHRGEPVGSVVIRHGCHAVFSIADVGQVVVGIISEVGGVVGRIGNSLQVVVLIIGVRGGATQRISDTEKAAGSIIFRCCRQTQSR